ncbi:MarC family protein [Endozoicomonadaceae bacterium StTr2]
MQDIAGQAAVVFMAFFAIMNPIANTAVFAGLTADMSAREKKRIAIKSLLITFTLIVLFSLLGKSIFHLFGITLPALRLTGGILVFLVGYHMLHGSGSKLHQAHQADQPNKASNNSQQGDTTQSGDLAISPLAVPLLAGPGTIATAMNYSAAGDWMSIIITISMFALLCIVTCTCFMFSAKIVNSIGQSGLSIVTRLMGLILAVIGMQMVISGVKSVIPLVS